MVTPTPCGRRPVGLDLGFGQSGRNTELLNELDPTTIGGIEAAFDNVDESFPLVLARTEGIIASLEFIDLG